jgi:hypothetical protein
LQRFLSHLEQPGLAAEVQLAQQQVLRAEAFLAVRQADDAQLRPQARVQNRQRQPLQQQAQPAPGLLLLCADPCCRLRAAGHVVLFPCCIPARCMHAVCSC